MEQARTTPNESATLARQGQHTPATASHFGFDSGPDKHALVVDAGAGTAIARTEAEIKASLFLAQNNPRDEASSAAKLIRSCKRPRLAAQAAYAFPRAGTTVTGPSVYLAREIARCWGNMRYGLRIISETQDDIHIAGYAFDMENNNFAETEARFQNLIFRKKGGWQRPDERDKRELINRQGALAVRNAILQLMPPDIIEEALAQAKATMEAAAKGEIEQDRDQAVRGIVVAFNQLGVTSQVLTDHLGHELASIGPKELADLRQVYASIRDGNTTAQEHFAKKDPQPTDAAPAQGQKSKFGNFA